MVFRQKLAMMLNFSPNLKSMKHWLTLLSLQLKMPPSGGGMHGAPPSRLRALLAALLYRFIAR